MAAADYQMTVRFTNEDGAGDEQTVTFSMEKPAMALLYFLPDDDTLWLGSKHSWMFMYETTRPGQVLLKVAPADQPEDFIGTVRLDSDGSTTRDSWDGRVNGKRLQAGEYRVVCYAKSSPEYAIDFTLTVKEGAPEIGTVGVTGGIMPSRNASDEEIWQLMTAPAVVFDNGQGTGNDILDAPGRDGRVIGHAHGTGTAL